MAPPNHTDTTFLSPHPAPSSSNKWGPYSSAKDFAANMAMVLVVLLCFTILGFSLTTAIQSFLRRRRRLRGLLLPSVTELQKPSKPAMAIEELLPSLVFSPGTTKLVDCAICLAEFVDGDRVSVLPACEHGFHAGCIKAWLSSSSSCPTCRSSFQATGEPSESLPPEP